jgi:sulfur carrier protein
MNIKLNDTLYEVEPGISLAAFIESIGLKPQGIAVALNCEVVPKDEWKDTILSDKMELVLVRAVSGG